MGFSRFNNNICFQTEYKLKKKTDEKILQASDRQQIYTILNLKYWDTSKAKIFFPGFILFF